MTGKLKIISSSDEKILKAKVYENVIVHFRDATTHSITITKRKKPTPYVAQFHGVAIEADSILFEDAEIWPDGFNTKVTQTQLRFYPND